MSEREDDRVLSVEQVSALVGEAHIVNHEDRLREVIETLGRHDEALRARLADVDGDYERSESELARVRTERDQLRERVEKLQHTLRWVGATYLLDEHEVTAEDRAKVEAVLGEALTDFLPTDGSTVGVLDLDAQEGEG